MFGFVSANIEELTKEEKVRYNAVYCGICRQLRQQASNPARLGLSYDMAFLALLLMSLYEPEETAGDKACKLHPLKPRPWINNEYIAYAADMNVALAYYKAQDDYTDEGKHSAKLLSGIFPFHKDEGNTVKDQRNGNHDAVVQMGVHPVIQQHTHHT